MIYFDLDKVTSNSTRRSRKKKSEEDSTHEIMSSIDPAPQKRMSNCFPIDRD